MPHNPETW